jgi:hypothetical protein
MKPKVFISYASRDAEIANAVCKTLEAENICCWIAPRDILPGEEYADAIIGALNNCQLFLIILSEESNSSPQVRREVERAVSKDLSILTFRIDNTILSRAMEYYLSNRHWLDASNAVLSKQLHGLKEAVRNLLEQSPSQKDKTNLPKPVEDIEPVLPVSPVLSTTPASLPPSKPLRTHKNNVTIWILVPTLFIILVTIVYFGLAGKGDFPIFSRQTATMTPIPTSTIDSFATAQSFTATLAAITSYSWVQEFAEPILSQIANRSPDFHDDFSNPDWSSGNWNYFAGASIENGQLVIAATNQWQGAGITAQGSDFVGKFKFTMTKATSKSLSFGFTFRGDPTGATANDFTFGADGWCGFGEVGPATRNTIINECKTSMPDLEQPTIVTIFVQGNQAAAYLNGVPMLYQEGVFHSGNEIAIGTTIAIGTATVSLDDFELWNLNR